MGARERNVILFFLQDDGLRDMVAEGARMDGWEVLSTAGTNEALRGFREFGENLALVVTDDMTGPDEGRHRGMLGVDFLQQRGTHMFASNIPFVILMFGNDPNVRAWVDGVGGWMVPTPVRMSVLLDLFNRLERDHKLPPKRKPPSGER